MDKFFLIYAPTEAIKAEVFENKDEAIKHGQFLAENSGKRVFLFELTGVFELPPVKPKFMVVKRKYKETKNAG